MPISRKDEWMQIAELDEGDHIRFTAEFGDIMGELGWEAKAFVGHLLGLWYDPFEHLLDYTSGEAKLTQDQPGEFDRNALDEPQEVVEYWAKTWSENDKVHKPPHEAGTGLNLGVDWYRDILRAKLVSLRIPKRLLIAYRDEILRVIRQFEEDFNRLETDPRFLERIESARKSLRAGKGVRIEDIPIDGIGSETCSSEF
jgi:hypothetical protein